MNEELVSIIMPSYNTGNFIEETIDSVINQTYQNWELLIVDDCSTDNTEEIIKSIKDTRIKFFKNQINSGAAISRNFALKKAKGRWIAFLDSDDLWLPEKLEKQIKFMRENEFYFSYTNYKKIDEKGNDLSIQVTGPKKIGKLGMYNYCWLGCLTVMYDTKKVDLIQIEDLKKNNDYAIWLKVIKKTNCYLLNENLAKYRIRKNSISNHRKMELIKYHYLLFKNGEKKNTIVSVFYTVRNLFFGVIKKLVYERKV